MNIECEFSFKHTYTSKVKQYRVATNSTITQFICDIKNKAYVDFDIDTHDTVMHIVEAGQYNNINGFAPELAPEIQDSDMTVGSKYTDGTVFYLRFIVDSLPHLTIVS